ncbi:hypothetical protein [Actinacidiphila yeochonensis]|uniref:hypothetical protein n=1 Tax=Actinacidiphila yeochonensis TaxID=89050 RepID=UPI000569FE04|nr:hypothetical protein [Actinacidiphila yeochonensis]
MGGPRRAAASAAGEMFLVGMDRQGVVRISRAVDERTLGLYLREIADELMGGPGPGPGLGPDSGPGSGPGEGPSAR